MNIFISWSGDRSRDMAEALRVWLPRVIQSVRPWVSSHNLGKGSKWSTVLSSELGTHVYGIICVTPENREKPWILFEAGALSKTDASRTYTLLLGLGPADVEQPLAQFNHTLAEENDVRALLRSINEAGDAPLPEEVLEHAFAINWPFLQERFAVILAAQPPSDTTAEASHVKRDERSMIEEILQLTRGQSTSKATLIGSSADPSLRATPYAVQKVAEDILREADLPAQITVQQDQNGNFMVNFYPNAGGSVGIQISGSSTTEDVTARMRSVVENFSQARNRVGPNIAVVGRN